MPGSRRGLLPVAISSCENGSREPEASVSSRAATSRPAARSPSSNSTSRSRYQSIGAEAQRGFVDPSREVLLGQRRAVVGCDGFVADELDGAVMAVAAKRLDGTLGREAAAGDHDARTAEVTLVIGHGASIGGPVEPPVSEESECSYLRSPTVRALYPAPYPQLELAAQALRHPHQADRYGHCPRSPDALQPHLFPPDHRPRGPRRGDARRARAGSVSTDAVADGHVLVVAPAGPVAGERWIVDLSARRAQAEDRLRGWATMLARHASELELEVGDENPRLALSDARGAFPADAVIGVCAARRARGPLQRAAGSPARPVRARRRVAHACRAPREPPAAPRTGLHRQLAGRCPAS